MKKISVLSLAGIILMFSFSVFIFMSMAAAEARSKTEKKEKIKIEQSKPEKIKCKKKLIEFYDKSQKLVKRIKLKKNERARQFKNAKRVIVFHPQPDIMKPKVSFFNETGDSLYTIIYPHNGYMEMGPTGAFAIHGYDTTYPTPIFLTVSFYSKKGQKIKEFDFDRELTLRKHLRYTPDGKHTVLLAQGRKMKEIDNEMYYPVWLFCFDENYNELWHKNLGLMVLGTKYFLLKCTNKNIFVKFDKLTESKVITKEYYIDFDGTIK